MIGVARQSVRAHFGLQFGPTPSRVGLALEHEQPGSLAEKKALAVQVERLAPLGGHRREPHEPAELQLLDELSGSGHDDVRPAGTNQVCREADRIVARSARRRKRQHHALCTDRTGDVNGKKRGPVPRNEGTADRARAPDDPLMLQFAEDLALSHRRAEDHGQARRIEACGVQARVRQRHPGGRERHRRATSRPSLLGPRQMIARVEVSHFACELPTKLRGVERRDP